ncbi:MAG: Gfo/Idh/MocA family protein [Sandarakinorhabdus sp.]
MSLRIGIIGAARVATYAMIAPAQARRDVQLAGVAARDPARAAAYAQTHGIARVFADYQALVADPGIDAIYVATPPAFHLEHARLAISAGKPVLVEKPFTRNAAEAAMLLAEAKAAGVPVFEAMHSRHHPCWRLVHELLPRIGAVSHVDAVFEVAVSRAADEFLWDSALGGGALMDLGVYPLAWVRLIAGEPEAAVWASQTRERGADARFAASLMMPGGITARVAADMTAPRQARLTIVGQAGTLVVTNPMTVRAGDGVLLASRAGIEQHDVAGPATFDAQLGAFVDHLAGRAPWPLAAEDPLRSMQAIDLVRGAATADS